MWSCVTRAPSDQLCRCRFEISEPLDSFKLQLHVGVHTLTLVCTRAHTHAHTHLHLNRHVRVCLCMYLCTCAQIPVLLPCLVSGAWCRGPVPCLCPPGARLPPSCSARATNTLPWLPHPLLRRPSWLQSSVPAPRGAPPQNRVLFLSLDLVFFNSTSAAF